MSAAGQRMILTCQRIALLACVPVCRTVSTDALQVLVGAAPLDLEVIRRSIAYKIKKGLPLRTHDWLTASDLDNGIDRFKVLLQRCLVDRWQTRWTNSDKGRVTYQFLPDVTFVQERPHFGFGLSLGFVLTGHGSFNAFLRRIGLTETADCWCGMGTEDWRHILTECPDYNDIRDLDGMGITRTGGVWHFSRALLDDRTLGRLGAFALEVFRRRRRNVSGSAPSASSTRAD